MAFPWSADVVYRDSKLIQKSIKGGEIHFDLTLKCQSWKALVHKDKFDGAGISSMASHAWSRTVKRWPYPYFLADCYQTGMPFTFLKLNCDLLLLTTNSSNLHKPCTYVWRAKQTCTQLIFPPWCILPFRFLFEASSKTVILNYSVLNILMT